MKTLIFGSVRGRPKRGGRTPAEREGFTLIETLVVLTVVVSILGATAVALGRRSEGGATLQSAVEVVAAGVALARQQAILQQTRTRWIVFSQRPPNGSADRYLRAMQVLQEQPAGSDAWTPVGNTVWLPRGVWIVPPLLGSDQVVSGVSWPSGANAPASQFIEVANQTIDGVSVGPVGCISFTPNGRLDPAPAVIAIAPGRSTADGSPQFENPAAVRGLRFQASGAVSRIDDANRF